MDWGKKALNHAQRITNASAGRGSATRAEATAAAYVQQELVKMGIQDVRRQAFTGLRSIYLFLSLAFGLALVGHGAFWLLKGPAGAYPALVISLAAFGACGWLLWQKYAFRSYPLRESLPHGPSQNVLAILPPRGETRQQVVLAGHLDSHRAVWWFASDLLVQLYEWFSPLAVYGLAVAPLLYALAILTQKPIYAWLSLIPALAHFLAWFTGMTADLGRYSPGANDNASSVGTLLALAERLRQSPLEHTEVWLAFTGCEESGLDGMHALLAEFGPQLKQALFVNFEQVGIGERLVYLQNEGLFRPKHIPAEVEKLVLEAGQQANIQPLRGNAAWSFSQSGLAREGGLSSVCILSLRKGSDLLPEWHRLTDTTDRLEESALERAQEFGWAVLQAYNPANKSLSRNPDRAGGAERINKS